MNDASPAQGGGVRLSWIRRARRSADAWEPVEIPLDEPVETYAVTIFSGATAVRSLSAGAQTLLYAATDEAADFGGPQATIDAAVAQVGAVAGAGPACRARVPVRSA